MIDHNINPIYRHLVSFVLIVSLLSLGIVASDCGLGDINEKIELPSEALKIPNLENIQEDIYSTTAVDINDHGTVIGWTESSNLPLSYFYEEPSRGFSIHASGISYHTITGPSVHSVWPLAINNLDYVVGAFVHEDEDLSLQEGKLIPCRAFFSSHDGENFTDVHPKGNAYSLLIMINDMNLAVGITGNDLEYQQDEYYFLYDLDSRAYVDFPFSNMNNIQVWVMNDNYVVVGFREDPSDLEEVHTVLFTLPEFIPVDTLPLHEIPYQDDIEITGINEKNQIVGNYTDLGNNFGFQGFTYKAGDDHLRLITMNINAGPWQYIEFNPQDINESGVITGTGYRIGKEFFLSQARACKIEWDLTGFQDITPSNRDSYSESYAINDQSQIVGYAGFMQDFNSVIVNRAFVVP